MISYTLPVIFLASVMLGGFIGTQNIQAQTFDITTAQEGRGEAVITVQLATNNTVVIPPNGTIIEVPGNITQIDNDTVVILPENETITEVPGNVTVITPPEPEPCGCPPAAGEEGAGGAPLTPVVVRPAPGQEVIAENGTELVANESQEEPIPLPPPDNETVTEEIPGPGVPDNETAAAAPSPSPPAGGEEGNNSNDTALVPAALSKILPWFNQE